MVNSKELIGTTQYLTVYATCCINQSRYNRVRLYFVLLHSYLQAYTVFLWLDLYRQTSFLFISRLLDGPLILLLVCNFESIPDLIHSTVTSTEKPKGRQSVQSQKSRDYRKGTNFRNVTLIKYPSNNRHCSSQLWNKCLHRIMFKQIQQQGLNRGRLWNLNIKAKYVSFGARHGGM
jgi:hypothetical protein